MRFFAVICSGEHAELPPLRGDEPSFEDPRAAWAWLKLARRQEEDRFPDWNVGEYTDSAEDWPLAADGTGAIAGSTPGVGDGGSDYEVEDPGRVYAVVAR